MVFLQLDESLEIPCPKGIHFQREAEQFVSSYLVPATYQLVAFVLDKRREEVYRVRFVPAHEIHNCRESTTFEYTLDRLVNGGE